MLGHTELEQILAAPHTDFVTINLDRFCSEIGIEQISSQVAREAIVSQAERVNDARKHWLCEGLSVRFVLRNI